MRWLGWFGLATWLTGCAGASGPAVLTVSPMELDFGPVPVQTSSTESFTISNDGGEPIEILSLSLVAGDFDLWDVQRDGDALVDGGSSTEVQVTFAPDSLGSEFGEIQVRTAPTGSVRVTLTGEGSESTEDGDGDGFSPADGDCDDGRDSVYPGAPELCDGRDNDCDGVVPADEEDTDSDGFRICDNDCDDGDGNVYPGAPEICDDKDSDCDGNSSDRTDRDGDGQTVCDGDCDDDESTVFTGADEICDDLLDNDCNGSVDVIDDDGDGHGLCSIAGDCDDTNSTIYPIVVDSSGVSPGDGTDATPFTSLADGVAAVVASCPEVYVAAGNYTVENITLTGSQIEIYGAGSTETSLLAAAGSRHFTVGNGASLLLQDVEVRDGTPSTGDGGAIDVSGGSLILISSRFSDNQAPGDGGAVVVANGSGSCLDTRFSSNTSADDGGAVALFSASWTDDACVYNSNSARDGGGMLVSSSTVDAIRTSFGGNLASRQGGGMHVLGSTNLSVLRATVTQNIAEDAGGGISLVDVSSGSVSNSILQDNTGSRGGGISVGGNSAVAIENNTLVANAGATGSAVLVEGTNGNSRVIANIAQANTGNSGFDVAASAGSASWNTAWQNTGVPGTEFAGAAAVDIDGNVVRNPVLTAFTNNGNPADDDLRLGSGSPEIDDGPPDSAYNDVDGSRNDRGHTGGPLAAP